MQDVSVSYNRYKFLGNEFLTWIWFLIENDRNFFQNIDSDVTSLEIGNRVVLENRYNQDNVETITIKGDDAGLEEGLLALKKGAVVTEINLSYVSGENTWKFSIKGESLSFSGFKVPETAPMESADDMEGAVLEKIYLLEKVTDFIYKIYGEYVKIRISEQWERKVVPDIKKWIHA